MKRYSTYLKIILLKVVFLSIALLLSAISFAQKKDKNLVPNPSFEIHTGKSGGDIKNAIPWLGEGTVDYYTGTEKNDISKYKGAHSGTCYAGLRFQTIYKEYMFVQLIEPLQKDRSYHFKMYVRLLGASTVVIKQLGMYLSDVPFTPGMTFDREGVVDSSYKKGIYSIGWLPIQGDYVAHGGEKYMIIGNFAPHMKDDFEKKNKWDIFNLKEAYYYIDDISLIKTITAADSAQVSKGVAKKAVKIFPDSFETGQIIEIKNLQFEKGNAKILKVSYKILDDLVRVLNNHPFMEIQINGHTDNQGNEKLSKERAKAVYDYLSEHGIISPMTYKGLGASQPIAPNDTDKNKAKNNRVEVLIIKE